jgi:hypothetical protein
MMLLGRMAARKPACRLASLAVAGLLGLLSLSCESWKADDALTSLQIVQVQSITSDGAGSCAVSGTADDSFRTSGTLDVYLPDNSAPRYRLALLVANNLVSAGGSTATEMNNITLNHFTVTLSAPGMTWSSDCPATFDSDPFTIPLAPGATAGYAFDVIKGQHALCLLAALNPQPGQMPQHVLVTVQIWAKGRHGGTSIESAPFVYTIDVCTGCLQDGYQGDLVIYRYPAGYPACNALFGSNPYPGDPCLDPGQDAPILCCGYVDAGGVSRAACPAVPTGKPPTTSTSTSTATSTST